MTTKLTRQQREALADVVMTHLGNLVEMVNDEHGPYSYVAELWGTDPDVIRAQLATWARRIPGDAWDTRLGNPDPNRPLI
jgi:hypothetical protein